MADLQIQQAEPLILRLVLTEQETVALYAQIDAVQVPGVKPPTVPELLRTLFVAPVEALVVAHRDRVAALLRARFEAAAPETQATILATLERDLPPSRDDDPRRLPPIQEDPGDRDNAR